MGLARSCTPLRSATVAEPPPALCTPGRPVWPATSLFGRSAGDEAMIRRHTFTSLVLAASTGALLAVLLRAFTPDPATPEAPRSLRLPSGRVVPVQAVSTGRQGQLDVPDDPRTAGWWRGSSRVGDPSG